MTKIILLLPDADSYITKLPRVPVKGEVVNHLGVWYDVINVYFHTEDHNARLILERQENQ